MAFSLKYHRALLRCRLCRRVALVTFLAILVIEAVLLVISARNFEGDQLQQREHLAKAATEAALLALEAPSSEAMLAALAAAIKASPLAGAVLLGPDGSKAGQVGAPIPADMLSRLGTVPRIRAEDGRFCFGRWSMASLQGSRGYDLAVSLDSSGVRAAVTDFIWRIIGLVLVISVFVTGVLMLFLGRSLLMPILALRDALAAAGDDPALPEPERHARSVRRTDELGEVEAAFNGMLIRIAAGLRLVEEKRAALEEANATLEQRVEERTHELEGLTRTLRREIAQREEMEAEVDRLSQLPEENPNPVLRIDSNGIIGYANPPAGRLLQDWGSRVGGLLPQKVWEVAAAVRYSGSCSEIEMPCDDTLFSLRFQPVKSDNSVHIYGRDITGLRHTEERLQHLANHDLLTGLANRTLFLDRLTQFLRHARAQGHLRLRPGTAPLEGEVLAEAAVMVLDIDGFKQLNAVFGHGTGDQVLQEVAHRLRRTLGQSATIARLAGDEFALLLPQPGGSEGAAKAAAGLHEALSDSILIGDHRLDIAASIGLTLYPDDGGHDRAAGIETNASTLLRNAGLAADQAKREGGGRSHFFVAALNEAVQVHREMEAAMRAALLAPGEQFLLHYQPKIDLASGHLCGAEALVRWQHPEKGFMPPGAFIPFAEQSRLILPLGAWVLEEACRQSRAWQQQGLLGASFKMAVNLSAYQLHDACLPELVAHILSDTGLDPHGLELEITESVLMQDAAAALAVLERLRSLGLSLAIDDFGTGYSSLAYLKAFPVDRVKIDKTFVDDIIVEAGIQTDPASGVIARSVISLGHALGLEVTAEGVEGASQATFLRDLGCDEGQGWHFGRPLTAEAFEAFSIQSRAA